MKVLFWIGYANPYWDKSTWEKGGIGGSEYCVLKLADYLDTAGHDVTITGDVNEGNWYGVKYIHYTNLQKYQGPIGLTKVNSLEAYPHYDVVIATNYIHYLRHLEELNIKFDRNYFWMHNEDFYRWYRGGEMPQWESWLSKIDKIVGVSEYHKEKILKKRFKALGYTPQQLNTYIHSIDNAICLYDYQNRKTLDKIPGRIVWSSSPDRGLDFILDNWLKWKQVRPDLSLAILSPPYGAGWFDRDVSNLPDVVWQGARCPIDLKNEIDKAEYWIYVSDYNETYCISALEMMMGGVKILTNGTGNIKNLIGMGSRGEMIDMIDPDVVSDILLRDKIDIEFNNRWVMKAKIAQRWAQTQNWDDRVKQWKNLISKPTMVEGIPSISEYDNRF